MKGLQITIYYEQQNKHHANDSHNMIPLKATIHRDTVTIDIPTFKETLDRGH